MAINPIPIVRGGGCSAPPIPPPTIVIVLIHIKVMQMPSNDLTVPNCNNTHDITLMVPISQIQDPHGSY